VIQTAAIREAAGLLRAASRIAVLGHVHPDADAIGSALGLSRGLQAMGKHVDTLLSDPVPEYARFLHGAESIGSGLPSKQPDVYVFADSAGIDRVGSLYTDDPTRFDGVPIVNVDHHRTNPMFGTVNFVAGDASSTSELSYHLLRELGAPIDADTATALLFGIVGDTGSFRNAATTPGALTTAAHLLELGADTQSIAFYLFESKTFAAARLWGRIVGNIELDRTRHIVLACMSQEMLQAEGAKADEAEGVAEYLRGVVEAEVVMLLKESEAGEIRVSMRSRPAVDVSAIASALGGGGHRQAAGCTIAGPFEHARAKLLEAYDSLNPR
jgi:phosphoesterase RecJ-like protein